MSVSCGGSKQFAPAVKWDPAEKWAYKARLTRWVIQMLMQMDHLFSKQADSDKSGYRVTKDR
jgi:hypothetical protein